MKFIALWLCAFCILVFGMQTVFGTEYFILDKELAWHQPWRFITSIFAHGSIGHLLSNLFALGLFGLILEGRIGPKKVLGLFLLSGVTINLFSPYEKSLGASGAIYAILGTLAVLRPKMMVWVYGMPMPMILAGLVWLAQDSIGAFLPTGIGHIAHISGLVIGVGYGIFLLKEFGDKPKEKISLSPDDKRKIIEWEERYMK